MLSTWKEIAAYLGVSVRTAQSWELERGLPVQRVPGPRARVFATPAALSAWLQSGPGRALASEAGEAGARARRRRLVRAGAAAGLILVCLLAVRRWVSPDNPAEFVVRDEALIVRDSAGRELWRKRFPGLAAAGEQRGLRNGFVADLNGDGRNEVVYNPTLVGRGVICYSSAGAELWRYVPHRQIRSSTEAFADIYGVTQVIPVRGQGGRVTGILAISVHYVYYPSQVALLGPDGRLLREYWHSGHVIDAAFADLDGDGRQEIYLAGISNAYKTVTLIVLNPDDFQGASEERDAPGYQLLGFPKPKERARLLLARSCLSLKMDPYNSVYRLHVNSSEIILETTEPIADGGSIVHQFSPDLRVHRAAPADSYKIAWRRALASREAAGCPLEDQNLNQVRFLVPPG